MLKPRLVSPLHTKVDKQMATPKRKKPVKHYAEDDHASDQPGEDDASDYSDENTSPNKKSKSKTSRTPFASISTNNAPALNPLPKDYNPISVLTKKFSVPILNKPGDENSSQSSSFSFSTRTLGVRRRISSVTRALHDHTVEGSLILYDPAIDDVQEPDDEENKNKPKQVGKTLSEILGTKKQEHAKVHVVVDPILAKVLRPHQIEGVRFMYKCATGRTVPGALGCIMADEMGLGKTLQCIALMWTLLRQSPIVNKSTIDKCIIACPSTLVRNWANELVKWLGSIRISPLAIDNKGTKEKLNDLSEYFSLLNFANPGLLGTPNEFRKNYENPILRGRDSEASEKDREVSDQKLAELWGIVSKFIIRRTNDILTKYREYSNKIRTRGVLQIGTSTERTAITMLKKLCNHPDLLKLPEDLEGSETLLPPGYSARDKARMVNAEYSGKMMVLDRMLAKIRHDTTDKIVLISNYTQTLDLFERLCRQKKYGVLRLDGSMSIPKRQKLVDRFNDPSGDEFVFLLSSKAGGCGINLIGANRLVLFDPGKFVVSIFATELWLAFGVMVKKKIVRFVYRFITTGTIEEKIFQRQSHKQSLSSCVVDEAMDTERHFSLADLRQLFMFNNTTACDTHETFKCVLFTVLLTHHFMKSISHGSESKRCIKGKQFQKANNMQWDHYDEELAKLPDKVLREETGKGIVSYVFQYITHTVT
ncbi:DNA repair and recombination protein RAD54 [Endogone sp. FLAS-F59071]|nr:DNA repair and recombination protein RAD54 [Endogone sp. FLAS-F59071]|eukprot:RUS21661.1 DNA repair and recombination protein RAD54 [Endogone sp. FLAS-F59071]